MSTLSAQLVQLTLFGGTAARRSYPPSYKRARPQNASEERLAAIVEGVLVSRYDSAQPAILEAVTASITAVGPNVAPAVFADYLSNEIIERVGAILFPGEFLAPDAPPPRPDLSLLPVGRPLPRCGERHLEALVRKLKGA